MKKDLLRRSGEEIMKRIFLVFLFCLICLTNSCNGSHLINKIPTTNNEEVIKSPSKNFNVKWKFKIECNNIYDNECPVQDDPIAFDGLVYFGRPAKFFYAVNIETGKEVWKVPIHAGSPNIHDDIVYITGSSIDNINDTFPGFFLYALNRKTGEMIWRKKLISKCLAGAHSIIEQNLLYISTEEAFYALDLFSGKEIWKFEKDNLIGGDFLYNSNIYVSKGNYIFVLEPKTGKELFHFNSKFGGEICELSAISNERFYFISSDFLYCINAKTGKEEWMLKVEHKVSYMPSGISTSPIVWNNRVYFRTADRYLYCLNAIDGKELWNVELKDTVISCPVLCDGVLYVAEGDYMTSFNPLTGERIWEVKIGPVNCSSPYIYDGKIFIGCDDGYLYCLE